MGAMRFHSLHFTSLSTEHAITTKAPLNIFFHSQENDNEMSAEPGAVSWTFILGAWIVCWEMTDRDTHRNRRGRGCPRSDEECQIRKTAMLSKQNPYHTSDPEILLQRDELEPLNPVES
jgi:hypothetical protein